MTIATVRDKVLTLVGYFADCEECNWTGPDRTNKSTARQDQRQHNRECH